MRVPNLLPQFHLPHGDGHAPLHHSPMQESGLLALAILIAAALLVGGFAVLVNYAQLSAPPPQATFIP